MIKRIQLKENNEVYFLNEGITQFLNTKFMHNDKQMKRSTENQISQTRGWLMLSIECYYQFF